VRFDNFKFLRIRLLPHTTSRIFPAVPQTQSCRPTRPFALFGARVGQTQTHYTACWPAFVVILLGDF